MYGLREAIEGGPKSRILAIQIENVRSKSSRKMINATNETARRMMEAAVDLFAENGFKGTSIRQIARMTETTISNIYYYFGSKGGLLFAILENATCQIVEELREVAESEMEPLERFKLLVKTHLSSLLQAHRKEAKILFLDEEDLSRLSKQFQIEILGMYRKELKNLQSMGYVHERNVTVLAFNIFGVINWHLRWHNPEGRMSIEEINEEMLAFVLQGILGPSPADHLTTHPS